MIILNIKYQPLCTKLKGSLILDPFLFPIMVIMLTNVVYHIQTENRKNYLWSWEGSFFYYTYIIKGRMPHGIL